MAKPWEDSWHVETVTGEPEPYCDGIRDARGHDVVKTDSGVYPPSIEQAHLIAAAPELYRALDAILRDSAAVEIREELAEAAEGALRKARG